MAAEPRQAHRLPQAPRRLPPLPVHGDKPEDPLVSAARLSRSHVRAARRNPRQHARLALLPLGQSSPAAGGEGARALPALLLARSGPRTSALRPAPGLEQFLGIQRRRLRVLCLCHPMVDRPIRARPLQRRPAQHPLGTPARPRHRTVRRQSGRQRRLRGSHEPLTPDAFEEGFNVIGEVAGDKSVGVALPSGTSKADFLAWVNKELPEREPPTYLGLPANAEKLLLVAHAEEMLKGMKRVMDVLDEGESVMAEVEEIN
jgi:hypothetical protein